MCLPAIATSVRARGGSLFFENSKCMTRPNSIPAKPIRHPSLELAAPSLCFMSCLQHVLMQDLLAQSRKLQALTKKLEEVKARKRLRTSQEISTNPEGHIIQYYSALFNTLKLTDRLLNIIQHYSTLWIRPSGNYSTLFGTLKIVIRA